jgi:hypothetical protein
MRAFTSCYDPWGHPIVCLAVQYSTIEITMRRMLHAGCAADTHTYVM